MPELIHLAIPGFIILLVAEAIFSARYNRDFYEAKDTAASLSMGVGNVILNLGMKAVVFAVYTFVYQFKLFEIGTAWWAWILLFFLEDFTYYVFHRTSHECRFFWASHVIHHSSQKFNLSTALRQTWTGVFTGFIFWLWLPLLGFHPAMVMVMQAMSLIYQFWIHTEAVGKLGPLEWVFNTPSHHRIHHAVNPQYIDRNHAGVLIIWDRMFGTFVEETEKPVYGISKNINTFNPLTIATHEWWDLVADLQKPVSFRDKLRYVFGPPGWRHDSSN
jgi:sterol desaturase/sphingolipid hydroxylase (fatty acid hydroxylase superfamily)